jgi:hypothetical protein
MLDIGLENLPFLFETKKVKKEPQTQSTFSTTQSTTTSSKPKIITRYSSSLELIEIEEEEDLAKLGKNELIERVNLLQNQNKGIQIRYLRKVL